MSNNHGETEQLQIENEIPICDEGWLDFQTYNRTLGSLRIEWKKGENGTKEMQIFDGNCKSLQIPKVPVPKKIVAFEWIMIKYFDQNVIEFLQHFRHLFASNGAYLSILSEDNGPLELVMRNIWPLIKDNIYGISLDSEITLSRMLQLAPSILNDSPTLRTISAYYDVFPSFPSDDSANASEGQLVAKWLFSPHPLLDGAPKMVKCEFDSIDQLLSNIDALKTAFVNASSSVNFIITIWTSVKHSDVPFELVNQLTEERLALKESNYWRRSRKWRFMIIRCPIARDEHKWTKWELEATSWHNEFEQNQIIIHTINTGQQFADFYF